jgi:hypothetical protein
MKRTLTVLFRRDPTRDRQKEQIRFRGYRPHWPDGRPVDVGLDAFCQHGQRLLGLNRVLAQSSECLIHLINFPVVDVDENIRRLPGHRVRRFFIERHGDNGRIHFMDGTPTEIVFNLDKDEEEVLHWIGLPHLDDGERQWFDLAACPVEKPAGLRKEDKLPRVNGHHEPKLASGAVW